MADETTKEEVLPDLSPDAGAKGDRIVIDGASQWNGEWPEPDEFDGWDIWMIKEISGLCPIEFGQAAARLDYDWTIANAVVALRHAEKIVARQAVLAADILRGAPYNAVRFVRDPVTTPVEEDDPIPPAESLPEAEAPGQNAGSDAETESTGSSGDGSATGSASPASVPTATGQPGSEPTE